MRKADIHPARTVLVLGAILILFGCGSTRETSNEPMLIGWVNRTEVMSGAYPRFQARYDTVQTDPEVLDLIRTFNEGTDWLVFLGSWCSDSYREVPAFLKIADSSGIGGTRIRYYALDRDKKSPEGLEQRYGVTHVPTIIGIRDGSEIGRITEKSDPSVEDEMLRIILGEGE